MYTLKKCSKMCLQTTITNKKVSLFKIIIIIKINFRKDLLFYKLLPILQLLKH